MRVPLLQDTPFLFSPCRRKNMSRLLFPVNNPSGANAVAQGHTVDIETADRILWFKIGIIHFAGFHRLVEHRFHQSPRHVKQVDASMGSLLRNKLNAEPVAERVRIDVEHGQMNFRLNCGGNLSFFCFNASSDKVNNSHHSGFGC